MVPKSMLLTPDNYKSGQISNADKMALHVHKLIYDI